MVNPQSLNMYVYVQNDPVNATDPLGLATPTIDHCTSNSDGTYSCYDAQGNLIEKGLTGEEIVVVAPDDKSSKETGTSPDPLTPPDLSWTGADPDKRTREASIREAADREDTNGFQDWEPSPWDSIGGILTALGVGTSELGGLSVELIIGAGTIAEIIAASGGVVGAFLGGYGIGKVINAWDTYVLGESPAEFIYNQGEHIYDWMHPKPSP